TCPAQRDASTFFFRHAAVPIGHRADIRHMPDPNPAQVLRPAPPRLTRESPRRQPAGPTPFLSRTSPPPKPSRAAMAPPPPPPATLAAVLLLLVSVSHPPASASSSPFDAALAALQGRIGYAFRSPDLLRRAMTHASYSRENGRALAVLGLAAAE
uniref:RNase III domain-containing protein n=1 Tax=Aegilops tauschii subsp. strangulata TaxID=200361 RepID=A0A453ML44_AEGTS